MRSRLFNRHEYLARSVLACAFVAGCGSPFSAAGGGSAGGSSAGDSNAGDTSVGGTANAGTGATSGSDAGGASGTTNSAGAGGKPSGTCGSCPASNYCQDGTNKCRSCADFSRLEFTAPHKLATTAQTLRSERFPRAASAGADLFYRAATASVQRLWYAATPAGMPAVISPATKLDSGPLLAAGVLEQNFFFDRVEAITNLRHIMLATWANGALSGETAAPAPLNGAASDFSIAVAAGSARAYWMSNRNGKASAELLWAGMVGGAATTPAVVELQVQAGAAACPWVGGNPMTGDDDATPWVNAAGTLLLFRSLSVDATCAANGSNAFDLYAAPLSKDTGQPTAPGVPLTSLNGVDGGSTQTDPSLSSDSCSIYFASFSGVESSSLFVATRN